MTFLLPVHLIDTETKNVIPAQQLVAGRIVASVDQSADKSLFPTGALDVLPPSVEIVDNRLELDLTH